MPSSIQLMAARAGREARANGLPCGEYVYEDPMRIETRYKSEGNDILAKYGSVANWDNWSNIHVEERGTKKWIFHDDIKEITGKPLTCEPAQVLPLLDPAIYLVMTKTEYFSRAK